MNTFVLEKHIQLFWYRLLRKCDIDVLGYENYDKIVGMYNQFKIQNLKTLDRSIRSSETCKKPITIVFWDIRGFSKFTKMFYSLDSEYPVRILRRILQDCKVHNCT
ncbi:hypothetical protein [Candidatus Nitrosocosmicus arcticus]|uniref:Uncharacterized protein n=1 Tax=Candidatus Nitrosocosmicus arcticus TaxID=2035267 RepID=A0A557SUH2_9ARCH|nr:hypothetical protein [Candidatus Nitrosocosmicus arcticus]TVP40250.1 hypothetical protein NARC_90156 [Candidatus Nitrosocosmicus arcticus]